MSKHWAILCATGLLLTALTGAQSHAAPEPTVQQAQAADVGSFPSNAVNEQSDPGGKGTAEKAAQGEAAVIIDRDASTTAERYASDHVNENALRVAGEITALISDMQLDKTGDSEQMGNSSQIGLNAGLLATDGASATLARAAIRTDGVGANAVFAYGLDTTVTVADSAITTCGEHSEGVAVAGGATLEGTGLSVETQGNGSAAIRANPGGGSMRLVGGTYVTAGIGSPAVDAAGEVLLSAATLTAAASSAVVAQGNSSVILVDCTVTGNAQGVDGVKDGQTLHNVMLYPGVQDGALAGESNFRMTGGRLTALTGDQFYVTNTACRIELTGVTLTTAQGNLLTVEGNQGAQGSGQPGENGGDCVLVADAQTLEGVVSVDAASNLDFTLQNGSHFTGTVNPDGAAGAVHITLDATSAWTLTADAYIQTFAGDRAQVHTNGFTLHIAEPGGLRRLCAAKLTSPYGTGSATGERVFGIGSGKKRIDKSLINQYISIC